MRTQCGSILRIDRLEFRCQCVQKHYTHRVNLGIGHLVKVTWVNQLPEPMQWVTSIPVAALKLAIDGAATWNGAHDE